MFRKLLVLVFLLALFARPALAEQEDIELAKRAVVRVVVVEGPRGSILGYGTGFAISNRKIVTNWHVVEATRDRRLRNVRVFVVPSEGNDPAQVRVLKFDSARDLALLQTPPTLSLPRLTMLDQSEVAGETITAIGYPFNNDLALSGGSQRDFLRRIQSSTPPLPTSGRIDAVQRSGTGTQVITHSATISPGNSGGPLIDDCGRVVGVNTFISNPDLPGQLNYAVPTRELFTFLGDYRDEDTSISAFPCRPRAEIAAAREKYLEVELAEASKRKASFERQKTALIDGAKSSVSTQQAIFGVLAGALVLGALGAGGYAVASAQGGGGKKSSRRRGRKRKGRGGGGNDQAILGGVGAVVALIGAGIALVAIPSESDALDNIAPELEKLESDFAKGPNNLREGPLRCVLNEELSLIRGAPDREITFEYRDEGCNDETQYANTGGTWQRVFVPREDSKARVATIDPTLREYRSEIFLLGRNKWKQVREKQMENSPPSCGANDGAQTVARQQNPVMDLLPEEPDEEWIYTCTNE